jgi:hypothetical protein
MFGHLRGQDVYTPSFNVEAVVNATACLRELCDAVRRYVDSGNAPANDVISRRHTLINPLVPTAVRLRLAGRAGYSAHVQRAIFAAVVVEAWLNSPPT